jgi:hypothetical protein
MGLKNVKLFFVYNANSSLKNRIFDGAHKIFSPSTYSCSLCSLTFGSFTEKEDWKQFRLGLEKEGYTLEFLHKDEFESRFQGKFEYPIILVEANTGLKKLIGENELSQLKKARDLIQVIQKRMVELR